MQHALILGQGGCQESSSEAHGPRSVWVWVFALFSDVLCIFQLLAFCGLGLRTARAVRCDEVMARFLPHNDHQIITICKGVGCADFREAAKER